MDYQLAAARRLMGIGAENPRARSIINEIRPVHLLSNTGEFAGPGQDAALPGLDADRLRRLARDHSSRIGLLCVDVAGTFLPLATAWPIAGADAVGDPALTRRFVTAGHVMSCVLSDDVALAHAGTVQNRSKRAAQVVFADGDTRVVSRWICTAKLDIAVFEIKGEGRRALHLDAAAALPDAIAVIGYPLVADVGLFRDHADPYLGRQFLAVGRTRRNTSSFEGRGQFRHDASTLPGFSGAPVLDPATGRVIGLHVGGSGDGLEHRGNNVGGPPRRVHGDDENDAILASALMQEDWLARILMGASDTPPPRTKTHGWAGGAVPAPQEAVEGRSMLSLLQATLASRRPGIAPADAGVETDRTDSRDQFFQPGLSRAPEQIIPRADPVGDQGDEGSCAAFALAAAIERQLAGRAGYKRPDHGFTASVRMLDRMARRHDEWLDDAGDGTSLRAVIKGFYHNGVCPEAMCSYVPRQQGFFLTRSLAKAARQITLGQYQRVRLSVDDMRMAIRAAGAVIVTADVHDGWKALDRCRIPYDPADPPALRRRHAFAVTGYDADGFIIKNARGPKWGGYRNRPGHALWTFDDWADTCRDAWVIRLAPPGDKAFAVSAATAGQLATPRRLELLGHILHAERTGLVEDGTLGLGARGVAETAAYLDSPEARARYSRLMLVFHEPLMDDDLIARLALRLTRRLKPRGIYAFHIAYGLDEMLACRLRLAHDVGRAVERYLREGTSRDTVLQRQLGPVIRGQVDHFAQGAKAAAQPLMRDALAALMLFAAPDRQTDVVSVGLGAIPAQALVNAAPVRPLPHLAIACPVAIRGARPWRLGDERDETDLPGWLGSWGDIVAGAHGRTIRATKGAKAATVQDLLTSADFVRDLLVKLPGR